MERESICTQLALQILEDCTLQFGVLPVAVCELFHADATIRCAMEGPDGQRIGNMMLPGDIFIWLPVRTRFPRSRDGEHLH